MRNPSFGFPVLLGLVFGSLGLSCGGSEAGDGAGDWRDRGSGDTQDAGAGGGQQGDDSGASGGASDAGTDTGPTIDAEPDAPQAEADLYGFAGGCYAVGDAYGRWLVRSANGFAFTAAQAADATPFFMKASDLATYLLYDPQGGYVYSEGGPLQRQTVLDSDVSTVDDTYVSGAEWELQALEAPVGNAPQRYNLRHRRTGEFLGDNGLTNSPSQAASVAFSSVSGCKTHPELSLDAQGTVEARSFSDGAVFGIAETHTHLLSNFGFGGGGVFHGSPFHRLGVAHALPDCSRFHGAEGRKDFFGYGYDSGGGGLDTATLLSMVFLGQLSEPNHITAGYPDFTEWPHAPSSSTHQTQYYMWLERAWMAGLRLLVQHATTNSVICDFMAGGGFQPTRYSCNDMVAVDRTIEESYAMERYIDAQAGGPGRGFFRIVDSPKRAREVINQGKMAIVLGIEVSNLFNCFLTPRPGMPLCDENHVVQQLDDYYARGVRALFPVHKYDNLFTPGDGNRDFIELGNFINSGHWSNFTQEDCPDLPIVFDKGKVFFGGLNQPRDVYQSPPPNNMSGFADNPILTMLPYLGRIQQGSLQGNYCQKASLTPLGEFLLRELMKRGMIIEIDHFPKRSYERVFEILEENDYPAAGTHGGAGPEGRLYALGGISKTNIGRCRAANRKGAMLDGLRSRLELINQYGGYPAVGLGFDLNGFAGGPGPRFGDQAHCGSPQEEPVTYPFDSYAGDVTFTPPRVGNRALDFNTEGLAHIGLLPELIEDARRDAESDTDLEPLFRSAEAYLRMWERAQARGSSIQAGN